MQCPCFLIINHFSSPGKFKIHKNGLFFAFHFTKVSLARILRLILECPLRHEIRVSLTRGYKDRWIVGYWTWKAIESGVCEARGWRRGEWIQYQLLTFSVASCFSWYFAGGWHVVHVHNEIQMKFPVTRLK